MSVQALADQGICSTCLMPTRVGVHKRGGYYTVCRHCGTRTFTSTPEGSITFRAMQRILKNDAMREALKDALAPEVEQLIKELPMNP